jgi:hypothetical protein
MLAFVYGVGVAPVIPSVGPISTTWATAGQQVCSATLSGTSCSYNGGTIGPCPGGDAPLCTCTHARATHHGWCPVEA